MKQTMVKLRRLVPGLAGGIVIMMTASFLITNNTTDRTASAEKTNSLPPPLAAPGAADSLKSTALRSSATTVPNNEATPDSTMAVQVPAPADVSRPAESLPGYKIAKSSAGPAGLPDPSLLSTGSSPRNLEIAVTIPPGEQAPVVFYDNEPRSGPQMLVLDEIARGFKEAIQREVPGYTAAEVWSEARDWADERYMYFFGEEDWKALQLQAALEAVQEQEAMGQMSQRSYE